MVEVASPIPSPALVVRQTPSALRVFLFAVLIFTAAWVPRLEFVHKGFVGHHAFKADAHLDTMEHIKREHVFARSDKFRPDNPQGLYFPKDGVLFYIPMLAGATAEDISVFRFMSLAAGSVGAAFTVEAALLVFGGLLPCLFALFFWTTSPLFHYFCQFPIAEPYLLLGIGALCFAQALDFVGRSLSGVKLRFFGVVVCNLAKFDGAFFSLVWALSEHAVRPNFSRLRKVGLITLATYILWGLLWLKFERIGDTPIRDLGQVMELASHDLFNVLQLPIQGVGYLIGDGTLFSGLSLALLAAFLVHLGLRSVFTPLLVVAMLRELLFLGYASNHNYYQFPLLGTLALGAAAWGKALEQIPLLRWKPAVIAVTAVMVAAAVQFGQGVIRPQYTSWQQYPGGPLAIREVRNFFDALPGARCLGVGSVIPYCKGFGSSAVGDPDVLYRDLCTQDPEYFQYVITPSFYKDKLPPDASIAFGNDAALITSRSDFCRLQGIGTG